MKFKLERVEFSDGGTLSVSPHLTLLVGPNNVGKSLALSEIFQRIQIPWGHTVTPGLVTHRQQLVSPDVDAFHARLEQFAERRSAGTYIQGSYGEGHFLFKAQNQVLADSEIVSMASADPWRLTLGHTLGPRVVTLMSPENRLGQLAMVGVPNLYVEEPASPIQRLWSDRGLEAALSQLAQRAFGIDLTVNRHGGSQTGLHVGKPVHPEPEVGVKSSYLEEIAHLPLAGDQGHGIQAFLGMVISLITHPYDIVLIDEPEAFLHPPQARLLGQVLVEQALAGTQVLVATHSDHLLQGVLTASASTADVTVARLTRPKGKPNHVSQVEPARVKQMFEDPLLRFSNVLAGLFYKGVVLCESEADCKYYSSVLEWQLTQDPASPHPDLLFAQCGGKDRLAKAVAALQDTQVPVAVIADIDLLADRAKFLELFTTMGGDADAISPQLNTLQSAVKSNARQPLVGEVRVATASLTGLDDDEMSAKEIDTLRKAISPVSGWKLIKKKGVGAVPNGEPTKAFESILSVSGALGLFLVSVGELESFHPSIGGTKAEWLRRVFEEELYKSSPAAAMIEEVARFISSAQ